MIFSFVCFEKYFLTDVDSIYNCADMSTNNKKKEELQKYKEKHIFAPWKKTVACQRKIYMFWFQSADI